MYIFVIDGGHRLSSLRAWMLDDYGDGPLSLAFCGTEISEEQKRIAKRTRRLIETSIGRYSTLRDQVDATEASVTKALSDVDALETAGNEPDAYKSAVAAADQDKSPRAGRSHLPKSCIFAILDSPN